MSEEKTEYECPACVSPVPFIASWPQPEQHTCGNVAGTYSSLYDYWLGERWRTSLAILRHLALHGGAS